MVGIIITGHANFALGMMSAVKLVFGSPENLKIVNFGEEDSSEVLENNIKTAIHELKECDGLLCFTDIAGGTPFQVASRLSMEEAEMRVISGTNLPMLLGVLSERDDMDLHELAEYALEVGREEVKEFIFIPYDNSITYESEDGGI
ncbi:EIIAB-Man [Sebaldella termitidis]|jgi:PTS system N-acetylgalactosamine-specific IIA component|uniref:PTS system fructose subfamily IIA component n=1 Tax=Sebaldella termitidis (strain ATCC 33386 / NCTC 11300) TaxID=526218 RepID=D1AQH5_SEBTE|nr:PTS galactosamine/N-acetylgalactosamine transporter subunit IIA [Sebaldella termitidis]ACZ10235.1 PTS system fructose subfamily IIA component [Sebaldella termitidis ATCC 33386]MBP7979522.1 PTS sugar transporter subunit IIA [Sebaldella sp.]SUI25574.1 EIIAB-Man [Sebaldella termitidis]